jgi:hypothetical protein
MALPSSTEWAFFENSSLRARLAGTTVKGSNVVFRSNTLWSESMAFLLIMQVLVHFISRCGENQEEIAAGTFRGFFP